MIDQPFSPFYGQSQQVAVTGAGAIAGIPAGAAQLMITNLGSQTIYVKINPVGDTAAATIADCPVIANSQVVLTKAGGDGGQTRLSYYAAAAGSTIVVTPGEGY